MKRSIIIILLLIFISTPIIGYKVVSANVEIKNNTNIINYQKELEEYITSFDYTIDNPNIIINPYKISPLTALIIFETPKEEEITITINGKDSLSTYKKTYPKSKTHYIEVYGLYPNYKNKVLITSNNIKKELTIETSPLPEGLKIENVINNTNNLYFIKTNNYLYALDNNNDVRWYLTSNYSPQINILDNGHLLLNTEEIQNNLCKSLVEIDLFGKIYKEYNIDEYFYGKHTIKDNNILVLSNNILEIDRQTGKLIKEYKLEDKYDNITYKDKLIYVSNNNKTISIDTNTNNTKQETIKKEEQSNNLLPIYTNNNYKKQIGLIFNTNEYTKEEKNNILLINYKKPDKTYNNYHININKEDNNLIVSGKFSENDEVYIILDKFLDKRIYKIDTIDNINSKHIHNNNLKGKYSLYIKIKKTIYKLNNYINF